MGLGDILGGKPRQPKRSQPPKRQAHWKSVRDKFFGGKEVVETTVTEQGSKTQVEERRTQLRPDGTKSKVQHTKMGDEIK